MGLFLTVEYKMDQDLRKLRSVVYQDQKDFPRDGAAVSAARLDLDPKLVTRLRLRNVELITAIEEFCISEDKTYSDITEEFGIRNNEVYKLIAKFKSNVKIKKTKKARKSLDYAKSMFYGEQIKNVKSIIELGKVVHSLTPNQSYAVWYQLSKEEHYTIMNNNPHFVVNGWYKHLETGLRYNIEDIMEILFKCSTWSEVIAVTKCYDRLTHYLYMTVYKENGNKLRAKFIEHDLTPTRMRLTMTNKLAGVEFNGLEELTKYINENDLANMKVNTLLKYLIKSGHTLHSSKA